jgi:hypothetical protein
VKRTFVLLVCFLLLFTAGLLGQRERPPATFNELRVEVAALRDLTAERFKSMRELLDERKEQVAIALSSAEKATQKAEEAQQRVNVSQNEFRGSLKDQASTLATKDSTDRLAERIANIEKVLATGEGRLGGVATAQSVLFSVLPMLIAGAGVTVALVALLWRRRPATELKKQ